MNKNALEWTVFGVSVALIAVCVAILAYEQLTRGDAPPHIATSLGTVVESENGYAVEIIVRNSGDRTAAAVHLSVDAGEAERCAEAVLEYVPYRSTRRAWVMLPSDPRKGHVSVRVTGYEER